MSDWIIVLLSVIIAVMYGFLGGLYITGANSMLGAGWMLIGMLTAVEAVLLAKKGKK